MKIALVQFDAEDTLWDIDEMPGILDSIKDVDLIVFPECMPFDSIKEETSIEKAEQELAKLSLKAKGAAIICGGYVLENKIARNAVFLSYKGKTLGRYFKRLPWQEPGISPGGETKRFEWEGHSCIPLICADAADNPSQTGTRMMYEAVRHGASGDVPIVVASYGAWLNTPYWRKPLQTWADGCEAPVVICGVSGKGAYFEEDGRSGHYGGGGTGVFWPKAEDNRPPIQSKERGIHTVDTTAGTVGFQELSPRK